MKLAASLRLLLLTTVFLSADTGSLLGQQVYPIDVGDRVRVSVPMPIDGDVVGFGDDQLIIRIPGHVDLTAVPLTILQGLEVQRVRDKSVLFAILGGTVAGAAAWMLVDRSKALTSESIAPEETSRRTYTTAFAAVGGAFAGWLIGKQYESFSWEVVPLTALQIRSVELDGLGLRATWALP